MDTRKTMNFRMPQDVVDIVKMGAEAAGLTATDFVERCIRVGAAPVVKAAQQERQKALDRFMKADKERL